MDNLDWAPERIKILRHRLGLNQTDFAALIGTTRVSLWKYESGITKPRDAYIIAALLKAEKEVSVA